MTDRSQKDILFLFTINTSESVSKKYIPYIFGDPITDDENCIEYPFISDSNIIEFKCGCTYINNDDNTIFINCSEDGAIKPPVVIPTTRLHIGTVVQAAFTIDFNHFTAAFGISGVTTAITAANMRLDPTSYIGFESTTIIIKSQLLLATMYNGLASTTFILYEPYNTLVHPDSVITPYVGVSSTGNILYNPYHLFFPDGKFATGYCGFTSTSNILYNPYHLFFTNGNYSSSYIGSYVSNKFVFDPYHLFFDEGQFAGGYVGAQVTNKFVFNPYNELLPRDEIRTAQFGVSSNTFITFDPYHQFDREITGYYGITSTSEMRYSDDQRISSEPILFPAGVTSTLNVKYANEFLALTPRVYSGITSISEAKYYPGFVGYFNIGTISKIRYLVLGIATPVFMNCLTYIGIELHDNTTKHRYLDLQEETCCTDTKSNRLANVEMTDIPDFDIRYGSDIGWAFKSSVVFTTQPRLTTTGHIGFTSNTVEEETLYVDLGTIHCGTGIVANARSLTHPTRADTGYGNFIIDQHEIKIELTKPLEASVFEYDFSVGFISKSYISITVPFGYTWYQGAFSNFSLWVAVPFIFYSYYGYASWGTLNRRATLSPRAWYIGNIMTFKFYEDPYHFYFGTISSTTTLIVENFVEFLEEGELDNEYLFQTAPGDVDTDRPNNVTIEGYPYSHYIKGRCY